MKYIEDLSIHNFRGLKNVKLMNTNQINILVGDNNSGKTSILEAIQLMEYPKEPGNFVRVARMREMQYASNTLGMLTPYESFVNLFNKIEKIKSFDLGATINTKNINIHVEGYEEKFFSDMAVDEKLNNGEVVTFSGILKCNDVDVEFKFDECEKNFKVSSDESLRLMSIDYLSPVDHYVQNKLVRIISSTVKNGSKFELVEMLNLFDENIIGLELIGEDRRTVAYLQHSKLGLVPLSVFGDGIKKVLLLACSILSLREGVLLIDEIETAIHISALRNFFQWFVAACKKHNTQVFVTTHSVEAIDAILEGGKNNLEDIVCFRLEEDEGDIFVNRISGKKLHGIRYDMGLDVR